MRWDGNWIECDEMGGEWKRDGMGDVMGLERQGWDGIIWAGDGIIWAGNGNKMGYG